MIPLYPQIRSTFTALYIINDNTYSSSFMDQIPESLSLTFLILIIAHVPHYQYLSLHLWNITKSHPPCFLFTSVILVHWAIIFPWTPFLGSSHSLWSSPTESPGCCQCNLPWHWKLSDIVWPSLTHSKHWLTSCPSASGLKYPFLGDAFSDFPWLSESLWYYLMGTYNYTLYFILGKTFTLVGLLCRWCLSPTLEG